MDFIDAGGPFRLACDVFAMRDEFDPRDHVPGGWRCETMVATFPWRARRICLRSRRGGCPCRSHVAIAGWVMAGERASRSGRRRRSRTAPEAGPVQLSSAAFRSLDGPARLEPVREAGPFTSVRGRVGNGVRDAGHDGNRVPRGPARRYRGDAVCCGWHLRSLRPRSRRSADRGWPVSGAVVRANTRMLGLAELVKARTRPMRSDRYVVPAGRRVAILESRTVRMTLRCLES